MTRGFLLRRALEIPARGEHHVTWVTIIRRIVEPDVGVVLLVEHVVDVEGSRDIIGHLVSRHHVHQPVGVLGEFFGGFLCSVVQQLPTFALPASAPSQGESIPGAGELVGRVEINLVFRLPSGDLYAALVANDLTPQNTLSV